MSHLSAVPFDEEPEPVSGPEFEFNLAEYLAMVRRHWKLAAVCSLLGLAAATVHFSITPKEYQATATLLIEEPAPGYAIVSAEGPDGGVFLNISAYIFGDDAPAVAERETPRWVRWMADHFAHPEGTSSG